MQIKTLTLYTNDIKKQKTFYNKIFGLPIIETKEHEFTVRVGTTKLIFKEGKNDSKYHYCFLIPSNKLNEAVNWLKERLTIVKINQKQETQFFESWNAEAVYFYDGNNNLVEFIARYDLKNDTKTPFDNSQIINVNEIGMSSNNKIAQLNKVLEQHTKSKFWKGDLERFGTNGDQNGLFIMVNNTIKKEWFPTTIFPESLPFTALIEVENSEFNIEFKNEELTLREQETQLIEGKFFI